MASTQSTEDIAFLNSGRYLEWSTQETASTVANGVPTDGVSGIDVLNEQVVKVGVIPNSGASLDFRVWLEYEGLTGFKVIDGSDRSSIDYAWTQQINVSGAERIYVEVTAITTGNFDVQIGRAVTLPNTVLRRRRVITNWSDLGTGILGESVVYEDASGNQAQLEWDTTNSEWVLQSTGEDWVLIEDWSSGEIRSQLWDVVQNDGLVVNASQNRLEFTVSSGDSTSFYLESKIRQSSGYQHVKVDSVSYGGMTTPSSIRKIVIALADLDGDRDSLPRWDMSFTNNSDGSFYGEGTNRFENGTSDFRTKISSLDPSVLYTVLTATTTLISQNTEGIVEIFDGATSQGTSLGFFNGSYRSPAYLILSYNNGGVTFSGGPYTITLGSIWMRK